MDRLRKKRRRCTEAADTKKDTKNLRSGAHGAPDFGTDPHMALTIALSAQAAANQALQIKMVVAKIADQLPSSGLLHLRQTCTNWNQSFTPELKMKHEALIALCNHKLEPTDGALIRDYTELMRSSPAIPFTSYRLKYRPLQFRHRAFADFFHVCGSSVRRLSFTPVVKRGRNGELPKRTRPFILDELRELIFDWTPNLVSLYLDTGPGVDVIWSQLDDDDPSRVEVKTLPSLKWFSFENSMSFGAVDPGYRQLLSHLFKVVTNLETLILDGAISRGSLQFLLSALRDGLPNVDKLRSLSMPYVTVGELGILIEMGTRRQSQVLGLSSFTVNDSFDKFMGLDYSQQARSLLCTFLSLQSPTLTSLRIGVEELRLPTNVTPPAPVRLPRLGALTSLSIVRTGPTFVPLELEGLTLQANCPHLTRLGYDNHYCTNDTAFDDPNLLAHDGVTELELNLKICASTDPSFERFDLGLMFPSVKMLQTSLRCTGRSQNGSDHSINILSRPWVLWPDLHTLHINNQPVMACSPMKLDEALSGVPETQHEALMLELAEAETRARPVTLDTLRQLQTKYKTLPAVVDLTNLRQLVVMRASVGYCISDVGGYLGLALLAAQRSNLICMKVNATHNMAELGGLFRQPPGTDKKISAECQAFIRNVVLGSNPAALVDIKQ